MLIAWWGFDSIKYGLSELAGKETIADINVVYQYIFEVFEVNTIPWLVAAVALINGFIGYLLYFKERSSKADIIEQMEGIRVEYEKLIDPDRSSSELTKRGETPK